MREYNIGVLVSGGGTNMQAIIDNIKCGELKNCKVKFVISSREDAYAIERAKNEGIETAVITDTDDLVWALIQKEIDIVVLAGYMKVLPRNVVQAFNERIINIHPSLIPKYSGKGFYGKRVHQAVIDGKERESGATCHLVDEGVDTGRILVQEAVPVLENDTAETLAKRVLVVEHKILSEGIRKVIEEIVEIERM